MAMLEVNDIKVYYGMIQAIKGVSFHVDEGEVIALIGANGAGKTTMVNLLMRFHEILDGDIKIDGLAKAKKRLLHGLWIWQLWLLMS